MISVMADDRTRITTGNYTLHGYKLRFCDSDSSEIGDFFRPVVRRLWWRKEPKTGSKSLLVLGQPST